MELSSLGAFLAFLTGDEFGVAYEELKAKVFTAEGPLLSIILTMAALTSTSKELRYIFCHNSVANLIES